MPWDERDAVKLLYAAAAGGSQSAQLALSSRAYSGRGVPESAQEGFRQSFCTSFYIKENTMCADALHASSMAYLMSTCCVTGTPFIRIASFSAIKGPWTWRV